MAEYLWRAPVHGDQKRFIWTRKSWTDGRVGKTQKNIAWELSLPNHQP